MCRRCFTSVSVVFTYVGVAFRLWARFYLCGLYLFYRCSRGFYLCRRDFTLAGVVLPLSALFCLCMRGYSSVGVALPLYAWIYLCWPGFTFVGCGIKSVGVA